VGRGKLAQIAVTNAVTFQSAQLDDVEGFVFNELKSNTAWLLRPSHGCDGLTDNWFLRFWSRGRELNSRPADYESTRFFGTNVFSASWVGVTVHNRRRGVSILLNC
jgi:hypothetical protein